MLGSENRRYLPHFIVRLFVERDLGVSRITATKYLEALTESGLLVKQKVGRSNYYINVSLYAILTGEPAVPALPAAQVHHAEEALDWLHS